MHGDRATRSGKRSAARARASLLLTGLLAGSSACIDRDPFACDDDEQCRGPDAKGSCEAPGYCASLDEGCASGLRFGRFAAPELAGRCIEAVAETGPMSSSSDGMSTSSTSSTGTTGTTVATTTTEGSSSSGEPIPIEECDGIDNDGDGLIDEWSPLNDNCNGCTLYQRLGYAYWDCDTTGGGRWTNLQPRCADFGANLASIHDASENLFLALEVESGANWIGLNDIGNEGVFTWIDGTPVGYTNWTGGMTPGTDITSNCVGIDTNGTWTVFACNNSRYGFCKAPHPD